MKRKNLKVLTIFAVLISFLLTGGIFAYWASNVTGDLEAETPEITIGVGEAVTTTLSLAETSRTQGVLVPVGYEKTGSVSQIVIVYRVTLAETENGGNGAVATLAVAHGTLPNALLNVNIVLANTQIIVGGATVDVTVTVTLTEPANYAEYNAVASMDFEIPLTFTATI